MKLKLVKKSDNAIHKYYALFEDGSVFSLYKQKDIKDVVNSIFEEEDVESISYPQGKRVFRRPILEKNEKVEIKKTKKPESFPSSLVYIISPTKVLTVYCDNQALSVHPTHANYHQILEKVRNNDSNGLVELYNVKKAIENKFNSHSATCGKLEIKEDEILFEGRKVNNFLCETILTFMQENLPWEHLGKFLENLVNNKHKNAFDETYRFLANKNLPITPDGCFLGWKRVRHDYYDFYSGTVLNKPGMKPEVPEREVCEDTRKHCSVGLHVGSRRYAHNFEKSQPGKVLLVKVNPADVVCVPEYDPEKIRVWRYEVLREVKDDEFLNDYYQETV